MSKVLEDPRFHRTSAATSDLHNDTVGRPIGIGALDSSYQLIWTANAGADPAAIADITPLAHQLADGERLSLIYTSAFGGTVGCQIQARFHPNTNNRVAGAASGPIGTSRDGEACLMSILPGFRVVKTANQPIPPLQNLQVRALRPAYDPYVLMETCSHIPGPNQPRLRDTSDPAPELLLPVQGKLRLDILGTLAGLAASNMPYELRIDITSKSLTVAHQLMLGRVLQQYRPDYQDLVEDPTGAQARSAVVKLLDAWQSCGVGWQITASLALPEGNAALIGAIEARLFGMPVVDHEARQPEDTLDLSFAIPTTESLPGFIPPLPSLERLGFAGSRQFASPPKQTLNRLHIGSCADRSDFTIARPDLARHALVLGATGTGKSTLLKQMIRQDIADGIATIVIDPHGDLFDDALATMPTAALSQAVIADASGRHGPFGIDVLNAQSSDKAQNAGFVANQLITIFTRVLYTETKEACGPMFESYFRNAVLLLMLSDPPRSTDTIVLEGPQGSPSLLDFQRLFHDASFRRRCLETCTDRQVVEFWRGIATRAGGEGALENIAPYIVSKLTQFTGNALIRPIISGETPPIDFTASLDAGKCMLFNLSKGSAGEKDASLIGALVTVQLLATLLSRCARPRSERPPVRIYMDEFQTYATSTTAQLLAEGRKAGAELVLASQDLTSFGGSGHKPDVAGAILSNVANLMCFRTGPRDARLLSDWYAPHITNATLMGLPDRIFAARTLDAGVPQIPALVRTIEEDLQ